MNKENISGVFFLIFPFIFISQFPPPGLPFQTLVTFTIICWVSGMYFIYLGNKKEKEKQLEIERINQIEKDNKTRLNAQLAYSKRQLENIIAARKLVVSQNNILKELDKDGNGIVDIIKEGEVDFSLLFQKHKRTIIKVFYNDRIYIKEFLKLKSYLKTKKKNIQKISKSLKSTENKIELDNYVGILKNEVHIYNLVLFNSLNMIVALIEDDMIIFYEIHDSFDKLNIFNTNWENEVSDKLTNIGGKLDNLMYSIDAMGQSIVEEIGNLSYVTEESNKMLENRLAEVGSQIIVNNVLTGIQTYKRYKIDTNTKSLKDSYNS